MLHYYYYNVKTLVAVMAKDAHPGRCGSQTQWHLKISLRPFHFDTVDLLILSRQARVHPPLSGQTAVLKNP